MTARRFAWITLALVAIAAAPPSDTLKAMRHVAIQHHGRTMPFDSFARQVVRQLTGAARWRGQDPMDTALSIMAFPERWQDEPMLAVPFGPLREALGLDRAATHVDYNQLVGERALMRRLTAIVQKQQAGEKLTMLEQETMDLFERFVAFNALVEQRVALVPPPASSQERTWLPLLQPSGYPPAQQFAFGEAWGGLLIALRDESRGSLARASTQLASSLREANPAAYPPSWRLQLEVLYNQVAPFRVAALLYALAAMALGISLARARQGLLGRAGAALLWIALLLHSGGILARVVLGGRPPVSNFFETMLWLPFVAVVVGVMLDWRSRARFAGLAAAVLAAIMLTLTDYVPLDPTISPVVAVLNSTLWLTVHVLTIVASYGALALAAVLAHLYAGLDLKSRRTHPLLEPVHRALYRAIQVGVVLLAGGIMLGAVWANASWGRYWGWDPKETWALITLLWFVALLHGRMAGWLKGTGLALGTIGGFFLLLMTYYGVSFYLVGLHSYAGGHAKPLPPLLIGYFLTELAFLIAVGWVALSRRRIA